MRDETAEQPAPLRSGLTTGSCATATSLAAARLLLGGTSADAVQIVADATVAIDRVVEPGGLMLLGWRLNTSGTSGTSATSGTSDAETPIEVDSYFRFSDPVDRRALNEAIRSITTDRGKTAPGTTEFGTEESEV